MTDQEFESIRQQLQDSYVQLVKQNMLVANKLEHFTEAQRWILADWISSIDEAVSGLIMLNNNSLEDAND
jgi:glyoxylate utilization-related uncharacterized protein